MKQEKGTKNTVAGATDEASLGHFYGYLVVGKNDYSMTIAVPAGPSLFSVTAERDELTACDYKYTIRPLGTARVLMTRGAWLTPAEALHAGVEAIEACLPKGVHTTKIKTVRITEQALAIGNLVTIDLALWEEERFADMLQSVNGKSARDQKGAERREAEKRASYYNGMGYGFMIARGHVEAMLAELGLEDTYELRHASYTPTITINEPPAPAAVREGLLDGEAEEEYDMSERQADEFRREGASARRGK